MGLCRSSPLLVRTWGTLHTHGSGSRTTACSRVSQLAWQEGTAEGTGRKAPVQKAVQGASSWAASEGPTQSHKLIGDLKGNSILPSHSRGSLSGLGLGLPFAQVYRALVAWGRALSWQGLPALGLGRALTGHKLGHWSWRPREAWASLKGPLHS